MRTDETKNVTSTNKVCKRISMTRLWTLYMTRKRLCTQVYPQADPAIMKPEFQQTKSLDFETKGL